MDEKKNLTLTNRITGFFSKTAKAVRREETTETGRESGVVSYYYKKIQLERTWLAKYGDYVLMGEEYPEISTALDLYADNATKEKNEEGNVFEIKSKNAKVQNILNELIERTDIPGSIWDTARNVAKMGDQFDEEVVVGNKLIVRPKHLEPNTMFVERDDFGREAEKPFVQKDSASQVNIAEFEKWQIVHWKNGGTKKMYGDSVLKPVRRVYKQLQLMEDGMVIGRLTRSHLRYKVLVDVEGMAKEDAEAHVESVKNRMRKRRMINPMTGQLDTSQNPLTSEEDFFIGVTTSYETIKLIFLD